VADATPFYPQAGGQPSDEGQAFFGGGEVKVTFVKYWDGHARHYVDKAMDWPVGSELRLVVDRELREGHSRIHTAGHLMDNLISCMPDVDMKGVKGFHFKEGSYVEFIGQKPADTVAFLQQLNEALAQAVEENHPVRDELVSYEQLLELGIYVPDNLPTDKPLRIVTIGDFEAIPCGGTHALGTAELGRVTVTKAKAKKDRVKVSYRLG
jgi:Ser-tRNA(Ala) deacylase AlaX